MFFWVGFPSPIGELHFSIVWESARKVEMQTVSVPYRGATFLNQHSMMQFRSKVKLFPSPIGELHFSIFYFFKSHVIRFFVSVPYRGATFLNSGVLIRVTAYGRFPSPIGELHFSIVHPPLSYRAKVFPSPIGELHFSIVLRC